MFSISRRYTVCLLTYCLFFFLQVPTELLGAAQYYWNTVAIFRRRSITGVYDSLTPRQIWRVQKVLDACGAAWRKVAAALLKPAGNSTRDSASVAVYALQETASLRELLSLFLIQQVSRPSSAILSKRYR